MRGLVRIALLLSCLLVGGLVRAQLPPGWSFSNPLIIGAEQGLRSTTIRQVVQDEEGFLWIATAGGLHRFDGHHMQVFLPDPQDSTTLPSADITALALQDGVLWVGTADAGLLRFDRRTHLHTQYKHQPTDLRALDGDRVNWLMVDRKGQLFVGTNFGAICLFRQTSGDFDRIAFPQHPDLYVDRTRTRTHAMVQDVQTDDTYWISTSNGLLKLSAGNWEMQFLLMHEPVTAHNLDKRTNNFRSVVQCPNGHLFLGTWGAGVVRYEPQRDRFTRYSILEDGAIRQFTNTYNAVMRGPDGTLWAGNNTAGLALLDTNTATIRHLHADTVPGMEGMRAQGVWHMHSTSGGDLLVITRQDVRLFSPLRQHFATWTFEAAFKHYVGRKGITAVLPLPDGTALLGGTGLDGLYRIDPSTRKVRYLPPPADVWNEAEREHFSVYGLLPFGPEKALAVSWNKLYVADLRTGTMELAESPFNARAWNTFFLGIERHSSGDIFILGRHDGLIRLSADLRQMRQYLPIPGDSGSIGHGNYLYAAAEDGTGRLWVGHEKGFSVFDPLTERFENFDPTGRTDSLATLRSVVNVARDARGRIWLADAQHGLVVMDDPTARPFAMRTLHHGEGLLNAQVHGLVPDDDGGMWIMGASGVEHLMADDSSVGYRTAQGLPSTATPGALALLPGGRLIGASGPKVFWEQVEGVAGLGTPLPVHIASVKVFERELDPLATYRSWSELRFRHDQNFFSILLSAIDPRGIHAHRFEYELHLFSGGWIDAGSDRVAVFTNVPSGDYTFRARAVAADGSVLGQLEMPLVMVPPYWETWWFRSAVVLAALALIYAFYRIRINAIRKEARLTTVFNKRLADVELTALRAQMNPHFLFNALNSIRHHVLNSRPEEADRYLSKFARLIRLILDHSDQRTVPLADELQALRLYLELEASRFDDKFSFHIQVDPSIDASTTMIPPLLIQPYLENAIWHGLMQKSEGGELVLRIGRDGHRLRIEVEDDGIGRAKAAEIKSRSALKKRSMGMSITQQRLAMIEKQQGIHCDLQVEDLVLPDGGPGGTRITLLIPLT
ncbi:MAG TPA: histidine kinase [Flavobacteriales bacterium]|nr:histidine kinase [Flavobacteriales bacterium]HRP81831.1 histidine kinase [Flavobacteriales bacterium]